VQLRRLSLRVRSTRSANDQPEVQPQLSTLTSLESLQVWPAPQYVSQWGQITATMLHLLSWLLPCTLLSTCPWEALLTSRTTLLCALQCTQSTQRDWHVQLPTSLTHLVHASLPGCRTSGFGRDERCCFLLRKTLPPLRGLRHLALHGLPEIGSYGSLRGLCVAAKTLPQLMSLHVVRMPSLESSPAI
jgi:hypothetical protein